MAAAVTHKVEPPPPLPWEWLEVCGHASREPTGWIPRWVAERLGVDCSALDAGGTVWFRDDQSAACHQSRWWRTPEQFADDEFDSECEDDDGEEPE